jgi:hypothetical protein
VRIKGKLRGKKAKIGIKRRQKRKIEEKKLR